ncbi:leucyl/phenylalanyl-tRNA--protein transferase [Pontibacter sp. G13]|uniref:leucyl/phenylalanyl-tRNA--protein transferase n=1 Tax=Pontibacter sp. G13 TaxID=3074898 RepID=UPI0028891B28|nr:leucyl/phenylalanyl-tRNA--protein transferase [Pontibacter sp. G13]WNJ19562.1 leucyl/phenylalanyl-tRNA--protein transferase [Pontibacter sp. G13]
MPIFALDDQLAFPPVHLADPEGILAVGGDLRPERLILAYQSGIFPWYSDGQPIIWWSPDPRFILEPHEVKVSKSMRKVLRDRQFRITYDQAFEDVIQACKQIPRMGQSGTWITDEMQQAYIHLHKLGYAHSVEAWQEDQLVGGLYGISLGSCFFGESMFAKVSNASKAAFLTLVHDLTNHGFTMIDCQVHTAHLESLGAKEVYREWFVTRLHEGLQAPSMIGNWESLIPQKN